MDFEINIKSFYANFVHDGMKEFAEQNHESIDIDKFFEGRIEHREEENIAVLSVGVKCLQFPHIYARTLNASDSILIDLEIDKTVDGVLSREQFNPFWSRPSFEKDFSKLPHNIQNVLVKLTGGGYISVLPVCSLEFNTTVIPSDDEKVLRISVGKMYDGARSVNGTFAVLGYAENPFEAVENTYKYACEKGLIKTRLKEEKTLDKMYKGLGWCTWNTCYRDVSEKLIIEKLEEFKRKNIPIKWVMIDDGWMKTTAEPKMTLTSFKADEGKFPQGLKSCIDRIKNDYGVEKVGVWHTITGYWFGVEKDSELYFEQKENMTETNSGLFVPDGEKGYKFFMEWYKYLKEQGVDFVKIDGQGNALEFMYGKKDCMKTCFELQWAVDAAVKECFDGNVINCMAMNNINANNRPYTVLSRNSDDFMPNKPETFVSHIMQNAYNAVFHRNLFFCDFDMWQSGEETAKQSSVLRAISGGPVYLSDGIGETNEKYIYPLLDDNGEVISCTDVALPMPEHLFCGAVDGILKLFNKTENNYVMAVFNMSDTDKSVCIKADTFGDDCIIRAYFAETVCTDNEIKLNIKAHDVEVLTFYAENHVLDFTKYIN